MNYFTHFTSPQLQLIHAGKVRNSYRVDESHRAIAVTDRISAFDSVLETPIPMKGAVLNGIANFWFAKTRHIIPNHFVSAVDPNITIVRELQPVKIEMIVRGYLTGSMWRYYQEGKREFSGIRVGDGMEKNQKFAEPLLTPTTKEDSDREITPDEIISTGLASREVYDKICAAAKALFSFGSQYLLERGIVLVDTKYEFGLLDGEVVLMDEIHTPDSSRFWRATDYENNPGAAEQIDKEFVRQWLIANKVNGKYPVSLPEEIVRETTRRYLEIYELITDEKLDEAISYNIKNRMYQNLTRAGLLMPGYVMMVMGSPADKAHAEKIRESLRPFNVMAEMRIVSAHKNGEDIIPLADLINNSIEPGAVIAIAGRSNGLGGALAANLNVPVISCPPFKDSADIMININSSLMMPSNTPAMTVVYPDNAALAAVRSLNIHEFRDQVVEQISVQKRQLREADAKYKGFMV